MRSPVLVALALDERKLDEETGEYDRHGKRSRGAHGMRPTQLAGHTTQSARSEVDEFCHEEHDSYSVMLPPRKTVTDHLRDAGVL